MGGLAKVKFEPNEDLGNKDFEHSNVWEFILVIKIQNMWMLFTWMAFLSQCGGQIHSTE